MTSYRPFLHDTFVIKDSSLSGFGSLIPIDSVFHHPRAQYSEWTVGPLSSVTCALCLCSLLAAISQFRVSIGQKMQLTGYENANNMRNAKCAGTQTSMKWPYCSFLYCAQAATGPFSPVLVSPVTMSQ